MSPILWKLLKIVPFGVVLPMVIAAATISPDDLVSNYSKWAHKLGISSVPVWLSHKAADHYIMVAAIVVAILYSMLIWGLPAFLNSKVFQNWHTRSRVPIDDAARLAHEAMERAGVEDTACTAADSSPTNILDHMKHVFLVAAVQGKIRLYGARPPSNQPRRIAPDILEQLQLQPWANTNNLCSLSRASPVDFYDVWLSRRDLKRVIKNRIALIRRVDRGLRQRG